MLAVPWALNAGNQLVTPREASPGDAFRCPGAACGSRLVLRAGPKRVRHFAHIDEERCSRESLEHAAAKYLIATVVVVSGSDARKRPHVHRRCPECGRCPVPLPEAVKDARVEGAVAGFRADVLLLGDEQKPLCAIEVLHTHTVSLEKAEGLSIPWIELRATAVLASPLLWTPLREGTKRLPCDHAGTEYLRRRHREARQAEIVRLASTLAELRKVRLVQGAYVAVIEGPDARRWPIGMWRSESMVQAIAVLEGALRDPVEFSSNFPAQSTVFALIRAWDGSLVHGRWRNGRWVSGPEILVPRVRSPSAVPRLAMPSVRRRGRL